MSDHQPVYETADLPMHNVEQHGYNAVPHQVVATPPPPPPASSGPESPAAGSQGGGSSSSGPSENK